MFRNFALITVLLLVLSIVPASAPFTTQNNLLTILPEDCSLLVGEALPLKLSGHLPSNAVVTWDADNGAVASVLPGSSAILVAPGKTSIVTVYATISDTKPRRWIYVTRQCTVTLPDEFDG